MATNPRLEQLKTALVNADRAGATEDARRLAEAIRQEQAAEAALQAEEFNRQQGFELQPKTPEQIKTAQDRAVREAERFREDQKVGGVEMGLREGAAVLEGSRGFLEQLAATPYNLYELGAATLEGRDPQYAQPQVEAQQRAAAWLDTGNRERGLAAEIGGGIGGALGMFPEMLATGGIGAAARVGTTTANLGQQTLRQYLTTQADEAARASALIAPRLGSQTAMEAEQAGATLPEALAAGVAETIVTPFTNVLPVSAAGRLGTRLATGAVGGIAAEAGTQGVVNPLLPEELAAQRDITNPQNATTAAGLGALIGAAFGTRAPLTRAQRVEQQRLAQIAAADETGKVAEGAAVVAQAEESARKGTVTESPLGPVRQEPVGPSSPFLPRAEGVDLETPRAEASTLLTPTEENIGLPRGPVSVLPGQEPAAALGLGTPRGEATPLTENPVQQARVQELTQERDALFQKGAPLTRKEKSRVKTINKELNTITAEQASFAQRAPVDQLARTALPGSVEPTLTQPATIPLPTTRASRLEVARPSAQPAMEFVTEKGSRYSVQEDGTTIRDKAARKDVGHEGDSGIKPRSSKTVYADVPTSALSAAGLSGLGEKGARVVIQGDTATLLTWNEKEGRWGSSPTGRNIPISTTPKVGSYPLELWKPADDVGGLEAYRGMHAGNKIVEIKPREATAPVVREDVIDLETGKVTGEQTAETGVPVEDARRRELEQFFSQPRDEPLSSGEILRNEESAVPSTGPAILPPEQRVPSDFEKRLAQVSDARGAVNAIRAYAKPGSPFARVLVALDNSPFLDNVAVKIFQPEDQLPRGLQGDTVRGSMQSYLNGRMEVHLKGSGFRNNGTSTPEIALHEIVHVASVDLMNGVTEGRIKDPRAIASVKRIDGIREELKKSLEDGTLRSQLTAQERVNLDYATKNSKEFVSQALSSTAVQSGLKKEGLWSRFVSAITRFFSPERKDVPLFEKIMDASLSVIQEQTRIAPEVRESRRQDEARYMASRAERMASDQAAIPLTRSQRSQAGLPEARQPTPQELRGTIDFTSVQGWRNGLGVSKDLFGDLFTGLMTSTRGVGTEVKVAERLRDGAKQETDLIVESFLNRVRGVIEKTNPSDESRKSINDRVMNYLRGNKSALDPTAGETRDVRVVLGNKELRSTLDSARAEMDNLTKRIGREIVRAYEGKPMPEAMTKKLATLKDGLGIYMTRVYESFVDRKYGADLLQKYASGDETAKEVLKPLLDRLTDQTAFLGENLDNAERVAKMENDALEAQGRKPTQQPWSSANWKKVSDIKLETMYRDLIGSPAGLPREQMFNELRQWFNDNVGNATDKKEASQKTAMRIVRDILLTNSTNTPMAQFWRKMRTDDRALKDLEDVPSDVRKALGEVKDPFLRAALTMSRQTAVVASLAQNNTLMEYSPQLFKPQADRIQGVHDFRIPNNPIAYGKLAGMFTDKNTHDFIVGSTEIYGADSLVELADLANKFRSGEDYIGAIGAYVLRKGMAFSQAQKFAGIVFNHGAAILDYAGIPSFIVGRGNIDPSTVKSAVSIAKQLVGTQFRKQYSDETRRIMSLGVIDPALTRSDEHVDQAMRETELRQKLRKGTATYEVIKQFFSSAFDIIRDARAFAENIPKVANYLNNEKFLKEAFPGLSQREIERLAVEKTLRTDINYSMVPKLVRLTESLGVGYVVSFMWESYRTGFTNHAEAIREIRSGNPVMRRLGIQRLIGSTAGLAGMSYLYGTVLASAAGALELDDEWDELMRYLGFHQQGQNRGILGVGDDLTVTSADFGRMDGMDVYSATWRSVAQMLGQFAEGDDEGAIETAKAAAGATASAFTGGAPLGTLALNTVTGKETKNFFEKEFPSQYDSFKAAAGEVVGESAATNMVDLLAAITAAYTPGSFKQGLRGLGAAEREEGTGSVLALAAGMPVTKDNPLATLEGFPARAFINTRREASSSIQDAVTIGTSKETPALMQSAVEDYISAQRDAYEQLTNYVNVAKAAGRIVGKSDADLTKLVYESLKKNNGFPDEQADRLSKGLPFMPTMPANQKTFLKPAIDRALGNQRQTTDVSRSAFAERRQQMESRKEQILQLLQERVDSYNPEQQ